MSQPENGIANAIADCDSQNSPLASPIRTDGRTDEEVGSVADHLYVRTAREERETLTFNNALGQLLDVWDPPDEERWPVVRTGEREPIRWAVRRALMLRDGFSCRICGVSVRDKDRFEIDHIVPWSAGGSDRSSNLRVLCQMCNQRRSNFADGTERMRVLPVTWWCIHCWMDGMTFAEHGYGGGYRCYERAETCAYLAPAFGAVQRIGSLADADQQAYCAHCRHVSWTEVTL